MPLAYADDIEIEGIILELTTDEALALISYLSAAEDDTVAARVAEQLSSAVDEYDEDGAKIDDDEN